MDTRIEISKAQIKDAVDVVSIFNTTRAEMEYLPIVHSAYETRDFFTNLVNSGKVILLKENDTSVGFMVAAGGWLYHLYIAPMFQAKGYGTLLLNYAKEHNPQGLKLWVFEQNHEAIKFYERGGFELIIKRDIRTTTNEENLPDRMYEWNAPTPNSSH